MHERTLNKIRKFFNIILAGYFAFWIHGFIFSKVKLNVSSEFIVFLILGFCLYKLINYIVLPMFSDSEKKKNELCEESKLILNKDESRMFKEIIKSSTYLNSVSDIKSQKHNSGYNSIENVDIFDVFVDDNDNQLHVVYRKDCDVVRLLSNEELIKFYENKRNELLAMAQQEDGYIEQKVVNDDGLDKEYILIFKK